MSASCGLGTRTVDSPRTMNWCLPPEYGPSKPRLWRVRISIRRLTGPNGGTLAHLPNLNRPTVNRRNSKVPRYAE
jgi:hypothetical protein